jgi:glucosamine-6-phosphate deaminase
MIVHCFETAAAAAHAVATRVADAVRAKPSLVLGLPAGQTPVPVYAALTRMCDAGEVDFSRVTTFNLDEFAGERAGLKTRPYEGRSFRRFMDEAFFSRVNVDRRRIHFLDGLADDLDAECRRYDAAIAAAGGIDLQLLGIGRNGHIGFNEPAETLIETSHVVSLLPETRAANAALFGGDPDRVPRAALTVGMGAILAAREILLMATGDAKAAALAAAVTGPVTAWCPASWLQRHAAAAVYADRLAASGLRC